MVAEFVAVSALHLVHVAGLRAVFGRVTFLAAIETAMGFAAALGAIAREVASYKEDAR